MDKTYFLVLTSCQVVLVTMMILKQNQADSSEFFDHLGVNHRLPTGGLRTHTHPATMYLLPH